MENKYNPLLPYGFQLLTPNVASAALNGQSHLILTMSDGSVIDAGIVQALPGRDGTNGINGINGINGTNGTNGTNAPLNLSIRQVGSNGLVTPERFAWPVSITVSQVLLMSNASDISVTIAGVDYDKTTLVGVTIPIGTELIINHITIVAGQENANAIIIF